MREILDTAQFVQNRRELILPILTLIWLECSFLMEYLTKVRETSHYTEKVT
jgi:hypothetical protein